jgi:hypothetical protein
MRKREKRKFKFIQREVVDQEAKIRRRAIFFGFLTLILLTLVTLWGIPLLIKFATFLGEIRQSNDAKVVEDKIPPPSPQFSAVPEATNSAVLNISGFSEPNSTVEIYLNDKLVAETQADQKGEIQVEKIYLQKGQNTLYGVAIDEAKNKSELSEPIEIVFDDDPPKLEITSPQDKTTVYDQKIEIKGKTESEQIKVTINDHLVLLEKEGEFAYSYELAEGENKIDVIAEDPAGNKTEKTLVVTYKP